MFKRILVGVDGSPHSAQAVDLAVNLAKQFSSEVMLLNVGELSPIGLMHDDPTGWAAGFVEETASIRRVEGKKILEQALKKASKEISSVTTRFEFGTPAKVICDVAAREKSDLIVLGSHGVSDLKGFLVGSVSHQVVQRSASPVLLVKTSKSAVQAKPTG